MDWDHVGSCGIYSFNFTLTVQAAKVEGAVKRGPRKKEHTLSRISRVVQERYLLTLAQLRSSSKARETMRARRVFTQAANAFEYRGKETAEYLRKDPASITGYLHGDDDPRDLAEVISLLGKERKNVNFKV